jgi:hypothetical protein
MNEDRLPLMTSHSLCFSGVVSRYAPHFLMSALCLAVGLFVLVLGILKPNSGALIPGIVVSACSLPWLIPMFLGVSRLPRQVEATSEGLVWQDKQGEHRCRWDEIREVYRLEKIVNQTFRVKELKLVLSHGEQVAVDQCLSDFDRLADTVQAVSAEQLLAAKRSSLDGSGAEFGPVVLQRAGLSVRGKYFPWDQVEQYTIFNGTIVVYPKGYQGIKCEEVGFGEVPNYPVLLRLLQELGQRPIPPEKSILFTGRR